MPKASEIEPDKNISLLLKGGPGEGKTIAASTFCLYGDVIIFYFDKKEPIELYTFYHKVIKRPDLLERIEYRVYSSHNVNEYLNDLMKLRKEPGRFVAGITDSVTNLTSSAVNWSKGFDAINNDDPEDMEPGWGEYKVETALVTRSLDICKALPWYNIWIAHPLPTIKLSGSSSGKVETVKQTSSLVSYGSKVAGIIPGQFTEIYHFNRNAGRRTVWTDLIGEDYAKSSLGIAKSLDITDRLFAEVWKDAVNKSFLEIAEVKNEVNPFVAAQSGSSRWRV